MRFELDQKDVQVSANESPPERLGRTLIHTEKSPVDSVPSGKPICSLAFDPSLAPQHDAVPMHIGQFVPSWTANLSFSRDEQIRPQGKRSTKLLEQLEYRRHVNRKTKDGSKHPDRDAQFEHINAKAREF